MKRILLVDDEPDLLEAWSFALQYVGHEVESARDGQEALRAIRQRIPHLLITDLMMPGMNGEDLCRAVRDNPEWADIPIVLHTSAHIGMSTEGKLWDLVLRKPAHMEAFLATIATLMRD